jgi:hypothetical protein
MQVYRFDLWGSHTGYVVDAYETEDLVRRLVDYFRKPELGDPLVVVLR